MLKKFAILTISFVTLFLVGCTSTTASSSGSGSGTDTATATSVTGTALKLASGSSSFTSVNLDSNTNIKQIIVNGETISVSAPSGVSSGGVTEINGNYYSGSNYSNSTFGLISTSSSAYLYAQGNMTDSDSMPTTGTASYSGDAVLVQLTTATDGTVTGGSNNYAMTLDVDFADKTLTGAVTLSNSSALQLAADISGSTFSGTSSDNTTVNGQFNGTGASEASGVLTNSDNGIYGSFGAVKQ